MTIKSIKPNVSNLKITVLVKRSLQGISTNNSPYLNLMLQDKTGMISARFWDAKQSDFENLAVGKVATVIANSILYNNEVQLKILSYEPVADDSKTLEELVVKAPIEEDKEWDEIIKTVSSFQDLLLKKLLEHLLKKYETDFRTRPAAVKMHHNTRNGLLWHTGTMLKMAKALVNVYNDREINHDLLFAGVIMHDFGKIWELSPELITKFTLEGQLIGHIVIGAEQVKLACQELNISQTEPMALMLQHLILSSHGKYEFGSPVLPKTLEAEILHHIDNLDAKITVIDDALKNTEPGERTNNLPAIEHRSFLKHKNN